MENSPDLFSLEPFRDELGLSRQKMGDILGIAYSTMWNLEHGVVLPESTVMRVIERLNGTYHLNLNPEMTDFKIRPTGKRGQKVHSLKHGIKRGGVSRIDLVEAEWILVLRQFAVDLDLDTTTPEYQSCESLVKTIWNNFCFLAGIDRPPSGQPPIE